MSEAQPTRRGAGRGVFCPSRAGRDTEMSAVAGSPVAGYGGQREGSSPEKANGAVAGSGDSS